MKRLPGCYHRRVYIPPYYRQDNPVVLRAFMQRHSFALLSIAAAGRVHAVHLPLLWRQADSSGQLHGHGVLAGHVARANPIWQAIDGEAEALAVFSGPHAYVSPRWYVTRPQVPTWNYTTVHAYGVPRIVDDPAWIGAQLEELVEKYETQTAEAYAAATAAGERGGTDYAPQHQPWSIDEEPEYAQRLLGGIVAFELPIAELQGKFKLNQNKSAEDRAGVIAGLRSLGESQADSMAELMIDWS